jgi:16S rRNA (guanine1516-N2)-methyltransferase
MIEKSPEVSQALQAALVKAQEETNDNGIREIITRMRLHAGNAIDIIPTLTNADIIYIDPMFPERKKSALVKKEMLILKDIVGPDIDSAKLLQIATKHAKRKVVVKRPKLAGYIDDIKPSFSIKGKSCRYDIYVSN